MRELLTALVDGAEPAVLATVVRVEGSSYRRPGAKMLLRADGPPVGMVSGGCLEADLAEHVPGVLASRQPVLLAYDLRSGDVWGLNQGCNGCIEVVLEPVYRAYWAWVEAELGAGRVVTRAVPLARYQDVLAPPPVLWVVGAGADVPPLVRAASTVGWQVNVVDRRVEPADLAARAGDGAFAVIMCHHFEHDRDFLLALLERPARYLGVLGPLQRTQQMLGRAELPDCVYAPVGLSLGGESPEEVALSIVAELQAVRYGRSPGHLRGQSRIRGKEGQAWNAECSSGPIPTTTPSR